MKILLEKTNAYKIFKGDCSSGKLSHAYMIVHPDEKNMRRILKEFAALLFDGERERFLIAKEELADLKIYPAEGKKLTVDIAGEIIYESGIKPLEEDKKVFVLCHFNSAGAAVQNKLLKILEEPPEGVIFILGAEATSSVLPTVLSRVRKLEIPPFSEAEVKDYLRRRFSDKIDCESYAAASGGIVGRAEDLAEGVYFSYIVDLAKRAVCVKESEIPALCAEISKLEEKQEYLSLMQLVVRDLLVSYFGGKTEILTKGECAECTYGYTVSSLLNCSEYLTEAEKQLKFFSFFPRIVEGMLMKFVSERKNAD